MDSKVIITILIGVLIVGGIFVFIKMQNPSASTASTPGYTPPVDCTPFTQAMQDAERRTKRTKCASKLLIPFVGQVQYYSCMKNIPAYLTPVKSC